MGAERYARLLRIYAGGDWTPERLERAALEEIETVRRLMDELSGAYLKKAYPREPLPATLEGRVIGPWPTWRKTGPARKRSIWNG